MSHLVPDHEDGVLTSRRAHYADWARHVAQGESDDLDGYVEARMSDAYSIHFHCWQPDTYLDFFAAAREKVSLDFELAAFAPPEAGDDGGPSGESSGRGPRDPPVALARCPIFSPRFATAS